MKLNSTENLHGILQGFSTLTADTEGDCRTALHNGTLYCVYVGEGRKIKYMTKPQNANWGRPTTLEGNTISTNLPSLVSFNNRLWLINTDEQSTVIRVWDESHAAFLYRRRQTPNIDQSATFAQLNNKLYIFYKVRDGHNIYCTTTLDMENWSKSIPIKKGGPNTINTYTSPVAITYQGLIHLFYKDTQGGFFLLKSDGENWTSPIPFIVADYGHSPGIAVHNGLLKLVFCNLSNTPSRVLYQYCYDGNSLSPVVASTMLSASGSPALSTQDGQLIAVYREGTPAP